MRKVFVLRLGELLSGEPSLDSSTNPFFCLGLEQGLSDSARSCPKPDESEILRLQPLLPKLTWRLRC